jgi:colanic acid biosynthesis glycosyl transferase WcaI
VRILIYGINYSPELTGIGKYTGEMASWLSHRGHEVRVVTAPPYYPAWSIREDYRGKLYRTEKNPGEPIVYRTPLYVPAKPTGLKRMAHLFSFMLGSLPVMLRQCFWNPDVVFTVEPTFFGAPRGLVASRSGFRDRRRFRPRPPPCGRSRPFARPQSRAGLYLRVHSALQHLAQDG